MVQSKKRSFKERVWSGVMNAEIIKFPNNKMPVERPERVRDRLLNKIEDIEFEIALALGKIDRLEQEREYHIVLLIHHFGINRRNERAFTKEDFKDWDYD